MACGCSLPYKCPKCGVLLERERKYDGAYIVIERVCKNPNCDSNYRIREGKINSCDIEI